MGKTSVRCRANMCWLRLVLDVGAALAYCQDDKLDRGKMGMACQSLLRTWLKHTRQLSLYSMADLMLFHYHSPQSHCQVGIQMQPSYSMLAQILRMLMNLCQDQLAQAIYLQASALISMSKDPRPSQ